MQTDVIDAYLDENQLLVEAVAQAQNRGRLHDAVHYQIKLHQNLIHLALAADQSPHLQRMDINPPDDTPSRSPTSRLSERSCALPDAAAPSTKFDAIGGDGTQRASGAGEARSS